jgi:hypothetical protein
MSKMNIEHDKKISRRTLPVKIVEKEWQYN